MRDKWKLILVYLEIELILTQIDSEIILDASDGTAR